ncbi:MAG: prolyl oligopeptidase family serine peptidase [Anaerolineae bacterium]|nr:prolyl oligopeptidase family serine peptidase [Anaerolineae bacterium]
MRGDWVGRWGERLPVSPHLQPLVQSLEMLGQRQATADSQVRRQLRTTTDFEEYRDKVRRNLWEVLGGMPERTSLDPRLVGMLERDGYRIEKVIFESRPRFYVTALVYVPTGGKPPFPAVLRPLGHYPQGKATYYGGGPEVQGHCIALARKGYVVLTFDPYGQLERGSYFDPRSGNNHFIQGTQGILTGMHLGQHYLWDAVRALDYLVSRPEVDAQRLCVTGTSGGGTQTVYLAAVDERLAVSVPVCYVMESHRQFGPSQLHPESVFPGCVQPYGPNNTALACCFAPKPQLIIGALHDPAFPHESMQAVYEEVRHVYRLYDAEERLALVLTDSDHGYTLPMRQAMYRWANYWLGVDADDEETEIHLERPDDLFCLPGGDVASLGGETAFSLNLIHAHAQARACTERRFRGLSSPTAYKAEVRSGLARSLLLHRPTCFPPATVVGESETGLDRTISYHFQPEPGFDVLLTLSLPKCAERPCPVVLHCNDEWNLPRAGLATALLRTGLGLVAIGVRLGPGHMALTFGRTEVGMAVVDLMRAADWLAGMAEIDCARLALHGEGVKAGLVALMAGALDERFRAVAAAGFEPSLLALVEEPDRRSDSHLLPGALRYYDVPDVCAAIAPRALWLLHDKADVVWPKQFYAAVGSPQNLRVDLPSDDRDSRVVRWLKESLC